MDKDRKIVPIGELLEQFSKATEKDSSNVDQLTRATHNRVDARRRAAASRFALPKVESKKTENKPTHNVDVSVRVKPAKGSAKPEIPKPHVREAKPAPGLVDEEVFGPTGKVVEVKEANQASDVTDVDKFDTPVTQFSQSIVNKHSRPETQAKLADRPNDNEDIVRAAISEPLVKVSNKPGVMAEIKPVDKPEQHNEGEDVVVTQRPNAVEEIKRRLAQHGDVETDALTIDSVEPAADKKASADPQEGQAETAQSAETSKPEGKKRWWWPFGGDDEQEKATSANNVVKTNQLEGRDTHSAAKETRERGGEGKIDTAALQNLIGKKPTEDVEALHKAA